jgi:hypothetical protein
LFIKQVSVFLENTKGGLNKLTQVIAKKGINLIAISIADTERYGILRAIVADTECAAEAIREAGYTVGLTDVLAVSVPDEPGGLSRALALLNAADISVEYLYSFVRNAGGRALVILRVDDNEKAARVLGDAGVPMLDEAAVRSL